MEIGNYAENIKYANILQQLYILLGDKRVLCFADVCSSQPIAHKIYDMVNSFVLL